MNDKRHTTLILELKKHRMMITYKLCKSIQLKMKAKIKRFQISSFSLITSPNRGLQK